MGKEVTAMRHPPNPFQVSAEKDIWYDIIGIENFEFRTAKYARGFNHRTGEFEDLVPCQEPSKICLEGHFDTERAWYRLVDKHCDMRSESNSPLGSPMVYVFSNDNGIIKFRRVLLDEDGELLFKEICAAVIEVRFSQYINNPYHDPNEKFSTADYLRPLYPYTG